MTALAEVRKVEPSARLVVVGEGPERHRLETLVRAHGVEGSVTFLGAMADPWSVLSRVDVFVLSSAKEGFPFALIEAMAAVRAIVASRVSAIPEIVEDGTSGILLPPGDARALADALLALRAGPARRGRLGAAAEARVRREFTLEQMITRTDELYRSLFRPC